MSILEMSLQASAMIAVIIIVRALGVNRLPKWGFQALWGIVIARLLLPLRVEFHLSAYSAVQQFARTLPPAAPLAAAPLAATPVSVSLAAVAASEPAHTAVPTVVPAFQLSPWVIAWLIGAVLLLVYFVIAHLRGRKIYAKSCTLSVERAGMFQWSRQASVRISNSVDAPLTYGVIRPVILMPENLLSRREFDCALAHELIHVRHWDALKKWLLVLAACVHWFNPLVWAMYVLANRDIELYCDEALVRTLGGGQKARYASMLLDLEEARLIPTPLVNHFGRTAIEERIGAIMKYRKTSILGVVAVLALAVFTTVALATSAVTPAANQFGPSPAPKLSPSPQPETPLDDADGWFTPTNPPILAKDVDPSTYLMSDPAKKNRLYQYLVTPALPDQEATVATFFGDKASVLEERDHSQGDFVQKQSNDQEYLLMWNEGNGAFVLSKYSEIPLEYRQKDEVIDGFNADFPTPSPEEGAYTQAEAIQLAMNYLHERFNMDVSTLQLVYANAEDPRKEKSRAYNLRFRYMFDGAPLIVNLLDGTGGPFINISVTDEGVVSVDGTALRIVGRQDYDNERIVDIDEVLEHNNLRDDPHVGEAELVYRLEKTADGLYETVPIWYVHALSAVNGKSLQPYLFYAETGEDATQSIE